MEIFILGDLNVHHQLWLSSPFTDQSGELAFNWCNTLIVFLTVLEDPPKQRCLWHFASTSWRSLRRY
ncbi:hypothetical protein E2C01_057829 [Portunus trituberculatus]|uniref:Endonuclease/exonuclease/phosphatase domain-containing protein n=1 Tax=Portunus trituberculatus TaxID=210409 RepID=A0A5B7H319_PORTR|nr:hypothetical protein [Portunus trituberculatus]